MFGGFRPRVGLVGCGFIGRFHARNIRGLIRAGMVDADYVAVCDLERDRAESFAAIAGVPRVFETAEELIASPEVNTVYVCTETAGHLDLVVAAAALGKAVFCEKPLARSLPEARRMAQAVAAAGVPNQVGLVLRYSPVYAVMAAMMRDPELGRPIALTMRDDQRFPVDGRYASTWRADVSVAGGGTLLEHSIHDVDLFRTLLGEIASVRCRLRYVEDCPGIEDLAVATFEHEGGALSSLTSVWHLIEGRTSTRRLEVFFERGWFASDHDYSGPILYQRPNGEVEEVDAEAVTRRYLQTLGLEGPAYLEAVRRWTLEDYAFLKALNEGCPAFPGFDVALRAHEVIDAAYRSAREGRDVRLDS